MQVKCQKDGDAHPHCNIIMLKLMLQCSKVASAFNSIEAYLKMLGWTTFNVALPKKQSIVNLKENKCLTTKNQNTNY